MGFGAGLRTETSRRRRTLSTQELVGYGMMAELLGRLPVSVQLQALGEGELLRILTEPPDAIVREYRELLALDEVELDFTEDALREVVRYSISRGLGARGLRSVLEHVMSDLMFTSPELSKQRVRVDHGWVRARLPREDEELASLH